MINILTYFHSSNGSIIMQQHSGVGIYQVVNPVIRDTVRPIPTVNQIGMPKRKFFRWVLLISTLKLVNRYWNTIDMND